MTTIFGRIVNGEIPAAKIYEDEATIAFLDILPATRGHTLVICKTETPDLLHMSDADLVAVARTTQRVALALKAALQPDGINIVQNNGAAAGQTVFHYHVHVIPRWEHDNAMQFWHPGALEQTDAQQLVQLISGHLDAK